MSLSFNSLSNLATSATTLDNDLGNLVTAMGANPSTGDLLKIQVAMTQLSSAQGALSSIYKYMDDLIKGIIQKMP